MACRRSFNFEAAAAHRIRRPMDDHLIFARPRGDMFARLVAHTPTHVSKIVRKIEDDPDYDAVVVLRASDTFYAVKAADVHTGEPVSLGAYPTKAEADGLVDYVKRHEKRKYRDPAAAAVRDRSEAGLREMRYGGAAVMCPKGLSAAEFGAEVDKMLGRKT